MADNTTLNTNDTSGDVIATDDIGGVKYQRVKLIEGADGTNDGDISSANPLPVGLTDGTTAAGIDGSGHLQVDIAADSVGIGGGTQYTEGDTDETITGTAMLMEGAADALVAATGDASNGLDVDVTRVGGTVTVDGSGVTQPVSGTVTANLSATDNAVLDQIDSNTDYGAVVGGGAEATALRVTLADDSTGVVSIDDNGAALTIDNDNTISSNNSTTTPLAGDATFTGTGDDCLGYTSVTIQIFADQNSATDGMTFQFSSDNSNWDDVYSFTETASQTRRFQFPVTARYFRCVYTNGSTIQGAFRMQTILHRQNVLTSIHRIEDNVSTDRSATLVKSAIVAQVNGTGDFIPIQSNAGGILKVGGTVDVDDISAGTQTNDVKVTLDGENVTETNSAAILADTAAMDTNLGTIAASVATEGSALGSGVLVQGDDGTDRTNVLVDTDGHLQVDVLTGGGSGTEYTEDDAAAANPLGGANILVRQDTPAALTSTDGDNVAQRGTDYGAAFCQILDSSGNFINSFGGSGGTSHADDAAFSIGSASSITPAGFLADDTTPDSVDEGDVGVPRMTLTRKPYAVITDPTSEQNAGVDASGHLQVDIAASSATVTTTVSGDALTALQLIDNSSVAHDAAAVAGVTQVGLEARTTAQTAVGDGDAVRALSTSLGKQVIQPYGIPADFWSYASSAAVTDTAEDTAKSAAGAGIINYVTGIQVSNGHDTVGTAVQILDDTAGTVKWQAWCEQTGGGVSAKFDPPLKMTANKPVTVKNVTTGASTFFNLQGYTAAE